MTLTELRYIVAVARERHFGRAAEKCFVSQPTLSVAVKKLEDELGIALFERNSGEVTVTPLGAQIVDVAKDRGDRDDAAAADLMQKALAARVPVVAAVSAPSSLAVEFAQRSGQTLVGFLRNGGMNVYTGEARLT